MLHKITGEAYFDKISSIQTCATYIEIPLDNLNDPSIVSLGGVASHVNPGKDGPV